MYKKLIIPAMVAMGSLSAPAVAQDSEEFAVSANVAFTNDYRFRGVSLSNNSFAVQGGFDVEHSSGLYVGTWASNVSIPGEGDTELDLYGGYGGEVGGLGFDVGAIYYAYPETDDFNYYELYGSLTGELGLVEVTGGLAYVPEQDNTGDEDNIYIYVDSGVPIGDSGASFGVHVGYEDGAFGDEKIDYAVSIGTSAAGLDFSFAWVGTEFEGTGDDTTDDALVVTVGKSF